MKARQRLVAAGLAGLLALGVAACEVDEEALDEGGGLEEEPLEGD